MRGLAALYIIKELMIQVTSKIDMQNGGQHMRLGRILKPCEVFDVIGGVSTGGSVLRIIYRILKL